MINRRDFLTKVPLYFFGTSIVYASNNYKIYINDSLENKSEILLDDKYISDHEFLLLKSIANKLHTINKMVGYGHFNIISYDDAISTARWGRGIKRFNKQELAFMETLYYTNPSKQGFYGDKTSSKITDKIDKKNVSKIPYTGHYLFKGESTKKYYMACKDVGPTLILTSGVRSIIKQMSLFCNKLISTNGNLSKASRSIAPPRYSFHTLGDFDVGKKSFGYDNFTAKFATTEEFRKMKQLNYIDMRYTINNLDGVRYEPWHVKII